MKSVEERLNAKADEWGRIMTTMFPNTEYDYETKIWDFSNNNNAVTAFTNFPEKKINMIRFSYVPGCEES